MGVCCPRGNAGLVAEPKTTPVTMEDLVSKKGLSNAPQLEYTNEKRLTIIDEMSNDWSTTYHGSTNLGYGNVIGLSKHSDDGGFEAEFDNGNKKPRDASGSVMVAS